MNFSGYVNISRSFSSFSLPSTYYVLSHAWAPNMSKGVFVMLERAMHYVHHFLRLYLSETLLVLVFKILISLGLGFEYKIGHGVRLSTWWDRAVETTSFVAEYL